MIVIVTTLRSGLLNDSFALKELEDLNFFLGVEIKRYNSVLYKSPIIMVLSFSCEKYSLCIFYICLL